MDTKSGNQPLVGGDSENFMRLMNKALTRIEQVDSATTKANESLHDYAKSFDDLNSKLERYVKLSNNAKAGKFSKITINEKVQNVGGESRPSSRSATNNNQYESEAKKITSGIMDTIFRSIDSIGGRQAKIVASTFRKVTNTVGDVKTLGNSAKAAQNLSKAQKTATVAAGSSSKTLAGLSASALGVTAVVGGVIVALGAMGAAGKYAYERNMDVNRSLMMMGDTNNELTSASSKTANQMIGIKNTWTRIGDDLSGVFEPVFTLIVDFVDTISKAVESVTDPLDKEKDRQFTSSDSKARWYTSKLESTSGEPENTSLPVIGNIASTAKQSGFDNTSAANLAIGTYDIAMQKARQYGVEASEVAQKLADAWTTGSDSAKQYGVVVDDQTLAGYMASKGVDIVNTQISDAMKQYYRYDLMQAELSADSNDSMQQQIKEWKQLGMQIDSTKQKLFSFDEVIQLGAVNTDIPTVGTPGVNYPNDESGSIPNVPPVLPGGTGGTPGLVPGTSPVTVPVVYAPQNEWALNPVPSPVTIPVYVPGMDTVGELIYNLGVVWGLLPVPVTVPVTVPGFDTLPALEEILGTLRGLASLPVTVPVDVPNLGLAAQLLTYCTRLSASPFMSTVAFMIPALSLAPTLLNYLYDIAKSWSSSVDIKVAGMNLLQKAYSLLQNVISLAAQAGQSVIEGVNRAYQSAVTNGRNSYAEAKAKNSAFKEGFSGKSAKNSGLLSNWSPVTSAAYGGGLSGAFKADLDLNLVRSGVKGSTAQGYSKQDIALAQSAYSGYNMNPLNKNGMANLGVKGAVASGAIAGGIGVTNAAAQGVGSLISSGASAAKTWLSGLSMGGASLIPAFGMASGGIGTKETTIKAFEGNRKEAVIPLETQAGVDYLANAMKQASGGGEASGGSGSTQVYLTLSGVNIADNEAQWQKVGEKIAEVIEVQRQRRGDLNYGSSF